MNVYRLRNYTTKYRKEILKRLSPAEILNWLQRVAHQEQRDKVVLMCYEAPRNFCHRHLVSEWLGKGIGQKIFEVKVSKDSLLTGSL